MEHVLEAKNQPPLLDRKSGKTLELLPDRRHVTTTNSGGCGTTFGGYTKSSVKNIVF